MLSGIAADGVALLHFAFILFVVLGGFLVLRFRKLAWLHVPAAVWGAAIEFTGWICPLTPLENALRRAGGSAGYADGFIGHYLLPIIYPPGLTRDIQFALALGVVFVNAVIYSLLLLQPGRRGGGRRWTALGRKAALPEGCTQRPRTCPNFLGHGKCRCGRRVYY